MLLFLNEPLVAYDSSENMMERMDTFQDAYYRATGCVYKYYPPWDSSGGFNLFYIDKYYVWPFGTHFHAFHQEKNKGSFAAILKDEKNGSTTVFAWGHPTSGGRVPDLLTQEKKVTAIASAENYFIAILEQGKGFSIWGNCPPAKYMLKDQVNISPVIPKEIKQKIPQPILFGITSKKTVSFFYTSVGIDAYLGTSNPEDPVYSILNDVANPFSKFSEERLYHTFNEEVMLEMACQSSAMIVTDYSKPSYFQREPQEYIDVSGINEPNLNRDNSTSKEILKSDLYSKNFFFQFYPNIAEKIAATENGAAIVFYNKRISCYGFYKYLINLPEIHKDRYIVSIATTDDAYAACLDNGSIQCWGNAEQGGTTPLLPEYYIDDSNSWFGGHYEELKVKSIAATRHSFAVILENGSVYSWGNFKEDVAAPDDPYYDGVRAPKIPYGRRAVSISSTDNAYVVLLDDGTVRCWGNEKYGGKVPENFRDYFVSDEDDKASNNINATAIGSSRKKVKKVIALAVTSAAITAIVEDGTVFAGAILT
ncbi:MAG: hypothetical protein ACOYK6_08815 [Chthoniobacterales bacterium]